MEGTRLLRTALVVGALAVWAFPATPAWADGTIDADETPVQATTTSDGARLEGVEPGGSGVSNDSDASTSDTTPTPPIDPIEPGTARCYQTADAICVADRAAPGALPGDPATPTPSLSDIATFPVTVATAHNQPTGWGVVDRPTNFYADGGPHIVSGTLLGQPARVRFTPVAWHWDYGDGTTASFTDPGAPWTPQTQLRPTATSHVYTRKNDFTITLFIDYVAEYQYAGQPWRPVAGALRVRANDLQIITWRVKTVLVAHDCIDDPSGAGCPGTLRRDDLEY